MFLVYHCLPSVQYSVFCKIDVICILLGFPGGSEVKASDCSVGDLGLIPGSGRSPGEGNGNPLQYSCLENPMDGGAWWATVHGVTKSWTPMSDLTYYITNCYSPNVYFFIFIFFFSKCLLFVGWVYNF